jgi:ech hydrogenase subunit D
MNMIEPQPMTAIEAGEIAAKAAALAKEGYRLVQICCTALPETLEVTYSFDKEYSLENYRVVLQRSDPSLPSITGAYLAAFTYENELQDLFGIKVSDMALNFNGNFYRIAQKTPFLQSKTQPKTN